MTGRGAGYCAGGGRGGFGRGRGFGGGGFGGRGRGRWRAPMEPAPDLPADDGSLADRLAERLDRLQAEMTAIQRQLERVATDRSRQDGES